jgi:hypothetical protein
MAIGMNKTTGQPNETARVTGDARQTDALIGTIDGGVGNAIEVVIKIIGVGEMTPATESEGTEAILLTRGESLKETAKTGL